MIPKIWIVFEVNQNFEDFCVRIPELVSSIESAVSLRPILLNKIHLIVFDSGSSPYDSDGLTSLLQKENALSPIKFKVFREPVLRSTLSWVWNERKKLGVEADDYLLILPSGGHLGKDFFRRWAWSLGNEVLSDVAVPKVLTREFEKKMGNMTVGLKKRVFEKLRLIQTSIHRSLNRKSIHQDFEIAIIKAKHLGYFAELAGNCLHDLLDSNLKISYRDDLIITHSNFKKKRQRARETTSVSKF